MSRTMLCALTAAVLALLSLATMVVRYQVLGDEVERPIGPDTWKVTLSVEGTSLGNARLRSCTPLDLGRQHIYADSYDSAQFSFKRPDLRHPERRQVMWTQKAGVANGSFRARSQFHVSLQPPDRGADPQMAILTAPPRPGQYLGAEQLIETNHERISIEARSLTAERDSGNQLDMAQALFHFVREKIKNDPRPEETSRGAVQCLEARKGDRVAKARLLTALLRNRNIPARIVNGVLLARGPEQQAHYWVEAWINDNWMPMCPCYQQHPGRVPSTYLVFGLGDRPLVRARNVKNLNAVFLIERVNADEVADASALHRFFKRLSLHVLPPSERRLVEILLLLPIAALIICIFRNLIGLNSFGTFAPALIGLAFHDIDGMMGGILVFVAILLIGWLLRRVLDHYHLLQVPRVATMLTLIMIVLISAVVLANHYGLGTTAYISLFPLIILTGMVERFWTLETEDSTRASFRTLFQTIFIALIIAVVLGQSWLVHHLFCYPETLGLVMAMQLLIGRYTGYRLMELLRFRDFLQSPPSAGHPWVIDGER